jgi:hypothetical protein
MLIEREYGYVDKVYSDAIIPFHLHLRTGPFILYKRHISNTCIYNPIQPESGLHHLVLLPS